MFKTALRNVLSHKGRLLMTMLAVVLGTAFVAGTLVFSDSVSTALKNSLSHNYDKVSVRVENTAAGNDRRAEDNNSGAKPLTDATLRQIQALPGTASAVGTVGGFAGISDPNGNLIGGRGDTQGSNWSPGADGTDSRYPMAQGAGPTSSTQVAIDQRTAQKNGFKVGDSVRIAANGPVMQLTVSGLFTSDDPKLSSGGSLVLFDTATAQKLYTAPGQYGWIDALAKPGTSQVALEQQVGQVVPHSGNVTLHTGAQLTADAKQQVEDGSSSMKTALLFFAGIALFVGIFLISNTFTMLIAQRTRELALMRALGASRKQVRRSVLFEALVVGFTASVVGLGAGIGIGAGLKAWAGSGGNIPSGGLTVTPSTALITIAVGTVVTALAALFPALRASRVPPVAAMSSNDQPVSQKSLIVRNTIGFVLTGLGVAVVLMGVSQGGSSGRMPVALGAMLVMLGVFVLTPLLSRPIIAATGPLFRRLFGVSGTLAKQNAIRNPRRTAATASALTIGVTLITALTVIGTSITHAITQQVTSNMKADYAVSMQMGFPVSPSLVSDLRTAKGVTASSVIDSQYVKLGDETLSVSGVDANSFDQLIAPDLTSGTTDALKQGQLLIDADQAKSRHLQVGSSVPVSYPNGTQGSLTVGGVYPKSDLLGPAMLSEQALAGHTTAPFNQVVLIRSDGGATSANEQALRDATGLNPLVKVQSQQQMVDQFSSIISMMLTILYALLGMAVLIAILGVVNTLAMSVFERKRELGMLRAVGLDKRGVKRMVRLESVVIAVFGAGMGVAIGSFLAWAANGLLKSDLAGLSTVLPWGRLALFIALGATVGLLAALWPARRAARLDILGAIKTD
ncbi:ABC transporter permease [Streptacidiphilus jiangxiensis]|uniref:Putative ABC transport system permease protein n=1 Tax=Streptacidiphilus jiangxiensis TaxID=235985 RepID=A0A1H7FJD8_STRJI|nr:ABC transporter permease [Streptacidiphilus jiangxiensis]SEK25367.1 putative ABC transport system permease protein [Streptacidiphilus jiangxiensis]